MLVSDFVFGIDGDGKRFNGFSVSLLEQFDSLVQVLAILPVTEIDSDEDRRADEHHDQPVVLEGEISKAGHRAGGQGNRRGPRQIVSPGTQKVRHSAQCKQL